MTSGLPTEKKLKDALPMTEKKIKAGKIGGRAHTIKSFYYTNHVFCIDNSGEAKHPLSVIFPLKCMNARGLSKKVCNII